ncbi:putative ATP-dependent RNA helicase BoYb [Drosophila novamexicana]|uniref:putative ATP-dependent RNA helicase BoYb n=1 Tax=Drosophila novamexicana TaxID=47314 RepID=UPI0011E5EA98|nr:putative ATP-dependent RNA helicase BoYb [Drosophila novamexicana]
MQYIDNCIDSLPNRRLKRSQLNKAPILPVYKLENLGIYRVEFQYPGDLAMTSKPEKCPTDNNNNSDSDSLYYEVEESFPFARHSRPLLVANCSEYAVAHSNVRLKPARHLNEVSFLPHILIAMRRLRFTQLLRLQSYAWPHLGQGEGHGAVIVSAPRSGRTLSYVPPLCQVVCTTLTEQRCRMQRCWQLQGPIALVLVADLDRVQQTGSLCNAMLRKAKNEEWLTLVLTVPSARTPELFLRLLNGVGCLVATPAQFLWLCRNGVKLPSLRFVAYDDVDLMPADQLQEAHQQLLLLTRQQRPQLVINTQSYEPKLLHMLREFNSHPMVLFGDVLEAAVYGGTRMRISLLRRAAKSEELLRVLHERPPHLRRTVINCHTDADICELVQTLKAHGYGCLPYYQTADLAVREQVHRWMQDSRGELLLCTDHCPELDIRHAHTLLHYSMSANWSLFKLRHLALADNLRNRLALTQPGEQSESDTLLSLVLLDESNHKQLPRLVDFLQMHQHVDERIVQLARYIRAQLERAKCNEPALCDLLLSLGNCVGAQCEQRHQLLPQDRQLAVPLPAGGDVKLQLIRVYTPAHYCVRLLEHLPLGGSWRTLPRDATLDLQLQLLQSQKCVRHWPPKAKEICIYRNSNGYERVRILRVAHIAHVNLSRTDVDVEVQALDVDTRQFKTTSGQLYICPGQLREAPPLAMDLRILGLVPHTGERSWHEQDGQQCAAWLNAVPQPNFLQARIVLALSHTLFVQDLALTSYAPSLKMHVRRLTMCQQLLRKQLAKKCEQVVAKQLQFLEQDSNQAMIEPQVAQPREMPKLLTATPLASSCGILAKMAMQLGKQNRIRLEREKKQQEEQQQLTERKKTEQELQQPAESVEALYKCLINCTLMELKDKCSQEKPLAALVLRNKPEAFHSDIMDPQSELPPTASATVQRRNKRKSVAVSDKVHDIQLHIPTRVLRPEVLYYQTRFTLELQIVLPEDNLPYEALLHNGCCITFWTLCTSATPIYQFILNTHCAYQQLSHHRQGRTVYVSLLKSLAVTYPLDFGFYKFMKPHHEKLHLLEKERRARIANFEAYLLHKGYIPGRVAKRSNSSDELSSDEQADEMSFDPRTERVERARDDTEFNCD